MKKVLATLAIMSVAACSSTQLETAASTALTEGQLFCGVASGSNTISVALQSTTGSAVLAKGNSSAYVNAACALINAIPVSPPANAATAPTVTVSTAALPTATN